MVIHSVIYPGHQLRGSKKSSQQRDTKFRFESLHLLRIKADPFKQLDQPFEGIKQQATMNAIIYSMILAIGLIFINQYYTKCWIDDI